MCSIEEALQQALADRMAAAWDRLDELAINAVNSQFSTPEEIKRLIGIALQRKGYAPSEATIPGEDWTDAMLAKLLEKLHRCASLRAQFASIPQAVHSIDRSGRLVAVTESWLEMLGYSSPDDVLGRQSVQFLTTNSQRKAEGYLAQFWRDGFVMNCVYTMVRADGRHIDVIFDAVGIRDSNNEVMNSLCVVRGR